MAVLKGERWSSHWQSSLRGAFRAAVKAWPDARLTIRQRMRALAEHPKAERESDPF